MDRPINLNTRKIREEEEWMKGDGPWVSDVAKNGLSCRDLKENTAKEEQKKSKMSFWPGCYVLFCF
jgi:hypothetical protein